MIKFIEEQINDSIELKKMLLSDDLLGCVKMAAELIILAYEGGGKVLFCGNGGSAADAQHLAAELVGRFKRERKALPAMALHANTSALTAIANDYDYSDVFVRQIEAFGRPGDVLVGLSTSGKSANVLKALDYAKKKGLKTIGFTGRKADTMSSLCDVLLSVPSEDTPRIQEVHMLWGHIICGLVEDGLFNERK
ncbi:MAG: D-sedoheptulose 7-phosphate isomerase [Acetomicrobium sp.]|nr:D-sedoheptulose 7-phosphate isomerase [Acetomicrobium sp.]